MPTSPRNGWRWGICGLLLLAACTDRDALSPTPPAPEGIALARLDCRVSVAQATLQCSPAALSTGGALGQKIIGNQDIYVKLASSGTSYDSGTEILQSNVTVQNLISQSMGTDGLTVSGVNVFFASGPTTTSGSGTVTVANADGTGTFTGANQPYFLYNQILTPYEISAARNWQFNVPSSVVTFGFTLYVATDLLNENVALLDHVWDGDVSTAWETAANWSTNTVPDSGSVVSVPTDSLLASPDFPVLAGSADVGALRVGFGSTLGLGSNTLRVRGNVDATGVVGGGTLWMSGTGAVVKGFVPALAVSGSASLQGSTTASGAVNVTGSLTVKDQALNVSIP
jgi:hypothetical protein